VTTFVGVEALLIPAAASALSVRFVTDLPSTLASDVPLCRLQHVGGGSDDDLWTFRAPTVSVDSFAADRAGASALAERVEQWFRVSLPGSVLSGSVVTKVQTLTAASWRPWDDIAVRRYGAAYVLHLSTR
jgi:hypothetical protein